MMPAVSNLKNCNIMSEIGKKFNAPERQLQPLVMHSNPFSMIEAFQLDNYLRINRLSLGCSNVFSTAPSAKKILTAANTPVKAKFESAV